MTKIASAFPRRALLSGLPAALLACDQSTSRLALRYVVDRTVSRSPSGAGLLLVSSLPEPVARALLDAFDETIASVEARATPLLADLLGESPGDVFVGRRGWLGPCARVATEATQNAYELGATGIFVEGCSDRGAAKPSTVALVGVGAGDVAAARVRQAAWPLAGSVIIETSSHGRADEVKRAVQALVPVENGLVGAVWTDASPEPRLASRLSEIQARAQVLAARARSSAGRASTDDSFRTWLDLLEPAAEGDGPPRGVRGPRGDRAERGHGMLPFWPRKTTDVLVLPRRGAVARGAELRATLGSMLRAGFPGEAAQRW